ncbi:MAG: multidrug ABC transporter ATP-binding protein [Flavobacteriaceae bacterium]|nr:multidrug ABC transporter ATP-binding protein [Flavobacteriaceae bacterium]|tara:strand:- start:3321 stop:4559 length:1239 start_codon:yes stop_codon:yes gene_type:complete
MFKFLIDKDTWQELRESLTKNKLRTVITMIGVWWGILLLIGLLGSAKGIENKFSVQFGDYATNSVFIWGQSTSKAFKGYQEGRRPRLKFSHLEKIKNQVNGVKFLLPRNARDVQVVRGVQYDNFGLSGDFPLLDQIQKKNLISGRFINQLDVDGNKKVAVISDDVYKQLFDIDEKAIGEFIKINEISYKVIGVFKQGDFDFGGELHIPFTTFQNVYNQGDNIGWITVTGEDGYDIRQIENDVKLVLKNLNYVHPDDNRAFGSFNLGELFERFEGFLMGMQFLTWFVGIATLIAGVFAIGNILLITVKERTKEIGIRRAIGATPFEIKRQIVLESIFLTIIAGIFGIISGGWILIAMDTAFGSGPDSVLINASVPIAVVFISVIILVVFGTLIGLIPANRATSIKPIDALREE